MPGQWGRPWTYFFRSDPRSEVDEELGHHLDALTREYEASGMDPKSARAAARARLGDLDEIRSECADLLESERRSAARRDWLKVSWLDFKLGFRMLLKYPGLTLVGGLALAFGIWVGAGTFEFVSQVLYPTVPLPEGDRIVGMRVWDAEDSRVERRLAYDLGHWREELRTLEGVGAFRVIERNLVAGGGEGAPLEMAEMSASGFDVARVPPLLGRTLQPTDEAPGAPPVVVLGYEVWRDRFEGDADVVGRVVRLGRDQATVVGVMPAGFEFPVAQRAWIPLRLSDADLRPREGPSLHVFGRLAPGASMREARAELAALTRSIAADNPETHGHLRPQLLPFARAVLYIPGLGELGLWSVNLGVILLLVLICGNVGLLLFARAATRENELIVRTALGASRGRIIGQLFVEALVLGLVAAAIGLAAAGFGLRWMYGTLVAEITSTLPFWFEPALSPRTIAYTLALTVLAATIAGVVPALKVTRGETATRLRAATPGGGGARFGGVWTAVIVAQIAVTLLFPTFGYFVKRDIAMIEAVEVGFPAEQYLTARLEVDAEGSDAFYSMADEIGGATSSEEEQARARERRAMAAAVTRELEERLEAHPAVAGVTFGERLPRMYHPHRLIELDEGGAAPMDPQWPGYRVSSISVTPDFFEVLQTPIVRGRGFHSGDVDGGDDRVVLVNESFVRRVLGGRNAIGRRLRYIYLEEWRAVRSGEEAEWFRIVGVVPDLGTSPATDPKVSAIYHPAAVGGIFPAQAAIHVRGDPLAFTPELRRITAAVDPALRVYDPMRLDQVDDSELGFYEFWLWILALVSVVAVTLSLAGIYAVMSFTVSRRTREIGIRVALGASRRRILLAIFRRPLLQVSLGVLAGVLLVGILVYLGFGRVTAAGVGMLAAYGVFMFAVCMLASIVPTRRALAVEPMEALRAEG